MPTSDASRTADFGVVHAQARRASPNSGRLFPVDWVATSQHVAAKPSSTLPRSRPARCREAVQHVAAKPSSTLPRSRPARCREAVQHVAAKPSSTLAEDLARCREAVQHVGRRPSTLPRSRPARWSESCDLAPPFRGVSRSEEHTSELQSHSFISYAVFCLKKKT